MSSEMVIISKSELVEIINNSIKAQLQEINIAEKPNGEELMTVHEACELLSCSKTTLFTYKKKGIIKSHRVGRRIFFLRSEIFEAIKSKTFIGK
jgi:DNA binding domain, excisionase family